MVMSTTPIKYAVPAGSARTRVLTALAARYTGCTVRAWDVWDGLDTHPASQNSGRFGYSFGKTRNKNYPHYRGTFARVIDNYETYAESLLDDFSTPEKRPQIAISVDMLDTGVDIPEVVNLV